MKKIILVAGDPNINSELIFKCWKNCQKVKKNLFLVSNYRLLKEQFKNLIIRLVLFLLI